ncbi:MAG: OmpA family protein [Nitrospinae bacterium]|nr:OmpA family protein [Nitrospinota bacterium]
MQTHRLAILFLAATLLTGCVGIEDYERKTDEATGLRGEIAKFESRIRELRGQIEELEGQIKQKDLDNQELSQSLTMARRHSQQTETRVADLRARTTERQKKLTEAARRVQRLQRAHENSRARVQELQKNLVAAQKKLLRFEDRIRFQIQVEKDVKAQFSKERRRGIVEVRRDGDRVVTSIASAILFKSGSAKIRSESKALLVKFSRLLRRYANREVQVQGHTDNVQISDRLAERWETNWELSAARATRVLRYFVEVGNLDPRRVSGAGMGEFRPIADNDTREGRRTNRRIEIVIFPPDS